MKPSKAEIALAVSFLLNVALVFALAYFVGFFVGVKG